jgi:hypothetical protein
MTAEIWISNQYLQKQTNRMLSLARIIALYVGIFHFITAKYLSRSQIIQLVGFWLIFSV